MELHKAAALLKLLDDYRVLGKLKPVDHYSDGDPVSARFAMVLDTETTGLDTAADKIIELGFAVCRYDADSGALHDVVARYDGFEDPCEPLSDVVRKLTGIDDAMVQGQKLDDAEINRWFEKSDLVIAHNAGFDRKMVERRFPAAIECNWACSFTGIDWQAEGIASAKLDYLAYRFGFFFEGHRAVNDAEATLHLLSMTLSKSGKPAMAALLESARKTYLRLVIRFKYDEAVIPKLKARKYRWDGENKVWYTLIDNKDQDDELNWLNAEVYKGGKADVTSVSLTAKDMFSIRV